MYLSFSKYCQTYIRKYIYVNDKNAFKNTFSITLSIYLVLRLCQLMFLY